MHLENTPSHQNNNPEGLGNLAKIITMPKEFEDCREPAVVLLGIKNAIDSIDPNWTVQDKKAAIDAVVQMGKQLVELDPFVDPSVMRLLSETLIPKFQVSSHNSPHQLPKDRTNFITPSVLEAVLIYGAYEKLEDHTLDTTAFNLSALNFVARLGIIAIDATIFDLGRAAKILVTDYANATDSEQPIDLSTLENLVQAAALIKATYEVDQQRALKGQEPNKDLITAALLLELIREDPNDDSLPSNQIKHWQFIADQIEAIVEKETKK